jgi:hypothetical protein
VSSDARPEPVYSDLDATYAVTTETTASFRRDVTNEDPDLLACWLIEDARVPGCTRCGAHSPYRALTRFTVNGVTYERDPATAHWIPVTSTDASTEPDDGR